MRDSFRPALLVFPSSEYFLSKCPGEGCSSRSVEAIQNFPDCGPCETGFGLRRRSYPEPNEMNSRYPNAPARHLRISLRSPVGYSDSIESRRIPPAANGDTVELPD